MQERLTGLVGSTELPSDVEAELVQRLEQMQQSEIVPALRPADWWGVLACLVLSAILLAWGI